MISLLLMLIKVEVMLMVDITEYGIEMLRLKEI